MDDSRTSPRELSQLVRWVASNGDSAAMKRVRMKVLPLTVRERIVLHQATDDTTCSLEYFEAVRAAAEEVVGRRYVP